MSSPAGRASARTTSISGWALRAARDAATSPTSSMRTTRGTDRSRRRHVDGELAVGVDARVYRRLRLEELGLPPLAVDRGVDVQEGLAQRGVLGRGDVDGHAARVDGEGQFLAGQVRGRDVWPGADVAKAHRVVGRAEVKGTAVEDPVDG